MKKIISPFIYFCGLIPVFYVVFIPTVVIHEIIHRFVDVDFLEFILGGLFLATGGSAILWVFNGMIENDEGKKTFFFLDHIRISLFYYVLCWFGIWMLLQFRGGLAWGYLALIVVISLHAVVINIIYLALKRKSLNKKTKL